MYDIGSVLGLAYQFPPDVFDLFEPVPVGEPWVSIVSVVVLRNVRWCEQVIGWVGGPRLGLVAFEDAHPFLLYCSLMCASGKKCAGSSEQVKNRKKTV